eukprot:CAMPEP_0179016418 /NCGR_PEP_ID=MMETSP0796-20121207/3305_1 /TAXON_ID=73915 /ORGANISM="Pyrodinium bahamense, Strain pbaha01" /LENGTH=274 /DNA_ID=CAMNT_0020712099 /DNA_START=180 /DNA_END=1003 /DNA_ORIENTATION=+
MAVPMASPKSRIASPWKRMSRPQRYKSLCNLHVKWVLAHDSDMHPSAATTLPMEPPQRVRAYCVPMQLPEASTAKPVATPIILIMEPMSSAQSASRSDRACSDSFRLNSALAWQLDTVNAAPCATPAKAEALRDVSLPHWKLHVVHSPAERTAFAAARNNVRMKEAESLAAPSFEDLQEAELIGRQVVAPLHQPRRIRAVVLYPRRELQGGGPDVACRADNIPDALPKSGNDVALCGVPRVQLGAMLNGLGGKRGNRGDVPRDALEPIAAQPII